MKLLVISDTHRYLNNAIDVLNSVKRNIDVVIHLGDHDDDAIMLQGKYPGLPFHYVSGNNDYNPDTPKEKLLTINGRKLLLTHGDRHRVYFTYERLYYYAAEKDADIVLFGHTHSPVVDDSGGLIVFNPGSLSLPRSTPNPTYGALDISDSGNISGVIMQITGKNRFEQLKRF